MFSKKTKNTNKKYNCQGQNVFSIARLGQIMNNLLLLVSALHQCTVRSIGNYIYIHVCVLIYITKPVWGMSGQRLSVYIYILACIS